MLLDAPTGAKRPGREYARKFIPGSDVIKQHEALEKHVATLVSLDMETAGMAYEGDCARRQS